MRRACLTHNCVPPSPGKPNTKPPCQQRAKADHRGYEDTADGSRLCIRVYLPKETSKQIQQWSRMLGTLTTGTIAYI